MERLRREIDRPLGQHRGKTGRFLSAPSRRDLVTLLGALVIVAGSSAIALREQPFRTPAPEVISTPEVVNAEAPEPASPERATRGGRPDGPAIIKVDPDLQPPGGIVVRDPSALRQNLASAHMPDRALIEESDYGPLPIRSADGRRPFDVYARAWSGARGARVAIVVGGLGVSQTGSQSAVDRLPPEVTLAFAPQGNSLDRWMQAARRKGHELLLQVPLEPFDYPNVDPGRNTLTVEAGPGENVESLHASLGRMTNYVGIINYMGARFVTDRDAMTPVMEDLAERGLLYLDDGSTARSIAPDLAAANRVPFAAADSAIDTARDRGSILKKLDELERTARARGTAIGVGFAFDTTIATVAEWAAEARRRGIEIVPVSALAADPERR